MASEATREDAIRITKEEIIFCDKSNKNNICHYRIKTEMIEQIVFDYLYYEHLFGIIKELEEAIIIYIKPNEDDIPEKLVVREHNEPRFRNYKGTLRSYIDENKIPLEIVELKQDAFANEK